MKEIWIVYCWLRNSVTIVGAYTSEDSANEGRQAFIDAHPDPAWEEASGELRNNTIIEKKVLEDHTFSLKQDTLEELWLALDDLLVRWSPNRDGSDYQCAFCSERPQSRVSTIKHQEDCLGKKLYRELNK